MIVHVALLVPKGISVSSLTMMVHDDTFEPIVMSMEQTVPEQSVRAPEPPASHHSHATTAATARIPIPITRDVLLAMSCLSRRMRSIDVRCS